MVSIKSSVVSTINASNQFNMPTGMATGDLLVVSCASYSSAITLPAFFTTIDQARFGTGTYQVYMTVGYAIVNSSNSGGQITVTGGSYQYATAAQVVLTGHSATTPIGTTNYNAGATDATSFGTQATTLNAPGRDLYFIATMSATGGAMTHTSVSGHTLLAQGMGVQGSYHAQSILSGSTSYFASGTSIGPAVITVNNNSAGIGRVIAINEGNQPPTVSGLFSGSINPQTDSRITWTYSDPESNAQTAYQIGLRKTGSGTNHNFTVYNSSNPYHTVPAGTLEEGVSYDYMIRVKDAVAWSSYASGTFTTVAPNTVESVTNLATATSGFNKVGTATVTNNYSALGSTWSRIQPGVSGNGGRYSIPLQYLTSGQTYTISLTIANPTASSSTIDIDWCDASSLATQTLAAGEIRKVTFNGTRATYDSTYRFLDVVGPADSDILVKEVLIAPRANKTPAYFNGSYARTNTTNFYWTGTPNASPSVKEVTSYENLALDPRATNTSSGAVRFLADRFTGNTTYAWVTGAADGPLGIATYLRGTVTTGRTGLGFHLIGNPETGTSNPAFSVPVTPGETINVSNYLRSSVAATWQVCIRFANSSNTWIDTFTGNPVAVSANTWTRLDHVRTVPAEAAFAAAYVVVPATLATGAVFEGTGLQVTMSSLLPYFDGLTASTSSTLYRWNGTTNNSTSIRTDYLAWTELTEVSSATPAGIIDAAALTKGDYEVEVATQDADGVYGPWSPAETFTLGPATNIKTRVGGSFVDTVRMVRQGGVWVPAAVTKTKQGGTFI